MDHELKCKTWSYKCLRKKYRPQPFRSQTKQKDFRCLQKRNLENKSNKLDVVKIKKCISWERVEKKNYDLGENRTEFFSIAQTGINLHIFNEWMVNQLVQLYHGIPTTHHLKGTFTDTHNNLNEPLENLAKWKNPTLRVSTSDSIYHITFLKWQNDRN